MSDPWQQPAAAWLAKGSILIDLEGANDHVEKLEVVT
jgi:hypothetical protein